jgi:hypothetical protein
MAIWRSLDPGWGVSAVRVVMGLSIDEVWLEPRRG